MAVGDRIRAARRLAGMTQEEVARRTSVTLKAYGELERGFTQDPHLSTLVQIAAALGVPVVELIHDRAEAEPVPAGKAEGPPAWAFTADMNAFSERVSRLPLDELRRLAVERVGGEPVLAREDLPLSGERRGTRVAAFARATVLADEFRARGVGPPGEFEVAYRRHLEALAAPTTPDVEAQRPAPEIPAAG